MNRLLLNDGVPTRAVDLSGDSRTRGNVGTTTGVDDYPTQLAALLPARITVTNDGFDSESWWGNLGHYYSAFESPGRKSGRKRIGWFGINDATGALGIVWTPDQALSAAVDWASRGKRLGDEVWLATEIAGNPTAIGAAAWDTWRGTYNTGLIANWPNIIPLHLRPELSDYTVLLYYNADGVHLTATGNGIVAATAAPYMKRPLVGRGFDRVGPPAPSPTNTPDYWWLMSDALKLTGPTTSAVTAGDMAENGLSGKQFAPVGTLYNSRPGRVSASLNLVGLTYVNLAGGLAINCATGFDIAADVWVKQNNFDQGIIGAWNGSDGVLVYLTGPSKPTFVVTDGLGGVASVAFGTNMPEKQWTTVESYYDPTESGGTIAIRVNGAAYAKAACGFVPSMTGIDFQVGNFDFPAGTHHPLTGQVGRIRITQRAQSASFRTANQNWLLGN